MHSLSVKNGFYVEFCYPACKHGTWTLFSAPVYICLSVFFLWSILFSKIVSKELRAIVRLFSTSNVSSHSNDILMHEYDMYIYTKLMGNCCSKRNARCGCWLVQCVLLQQTEDEMRLLQWHRQLEQETNGQFMHLSLQQTVRRMLTDNMPKYAEQMRKDFKIPDRRSVCAYSAKTQYVRSCQVCCWKSW